MTAAWIAIRRNLENARRVPPRSPALTECPSASSRAVPHQDRIAGAMPSPRIASALRREEPNRSSARRFKSAARTRGSFVARSFRKAISRIAKAPAKATKPMKQEADREIDRRPGRVHQRYDDIARQYVPQDV